MRTLLIGSLIAVALAATSCSRQTTSSHETDPTSRVLRIAVSADGTITLDGADVSLPALRDALAAAAGAEAVVWYYREDAQGEPRTEATLVIQAIIDNRLPISLSTEPDFSTVVSGDGTVRPR